MSNTLMKFVSLENMCIEDLLEATEHTNQQRKVGCIGA